MLSNICLTCVVTIAVVTNMETVKIVEKLYFTCSIPPTKSRTAIIFGAL